MAEIGFEVSAKTHADIASIAELEGCRFGRSHPLSVDEMACALLEAHLVLIRDCGGVLPDVTAGSTRSADGQRPGVIAGSRGVSLGDGINAPRKP